MRAGSRHVIFSHFSTGAAAGGAASNGAAAFAAAARRRARRTRRPVAIVAQPATKSSVDFMRTGRVWCRGQPQDPPRAEDGSAARHTWTSNQRSPRGATSVVQVGAYTWRMHVIVIQCKQQPSPPVCRTCCLFLAHVLAMRGAHAGDPLGDPVCLRRARAFAVLPATIAAWHTAFVCGARSAPRL